MGSAIYLSEYASPRVRSVLKPILEILAGIPSVVLGFFAIAWIAPKVVSRFFDPAERGEPRRCRHRRRHPRDPADRVGVRGRHALGPHGLREASYGMGATKVTTVTRVVLPAAVSGLVAAFIIAVSRAIGETMVVALAAGAVDNAQFTTEPARVGLHHDRGHGLDRHRHRPGAGCRATPCRASTSSGSCSS